ncbi:MAG: fumarylacetoacetate hydrolase family protein [Alphaproteobacteria bacterium]|nr:fumarylacetoacetate hydrolase family protein [Alphaproteobacteria bacterium]
MKLCRFDEDRLGVTDGERIHDVTGALAVLPAMSWPVPPGDALIAHLDRIVERAADLVDSAAARPLADVRLLSPVANPTKVIGAPVNYHKHLDEAQADAGINFGQDIKTIDHYGLFLKANSALVGPGEGIALRFTDRRNDHEAELVTVIGKGGSDIPRDRAFDHIAGYTMGLDMTVRGTEDRSLRKSVDSYAVIGPWLVTADEIADPDAIDFELRVNGEVRQASNTRHLIFDIARLVEYASSFYTLYPGDLIMTGTPEGVGPVKAGDVIDFTMDGIGAMRVAVRAA